MKDEGGGEEKIGLRRSQTIW